MHAVDKVTEQMIRTVARFAFLHPHTPMDLVLASLDRMA
jgi:hypothetical protein